MADEPLDLSAAPPRPSGAYTQAESRLLVLAGAPALPSSHRRAPPAEREPEPSLSWARPTGQGLYTPLEAEALLEALLLDGAGATAAALCRAVPAQDELMVALLEFFEAHGRGFDLVVNELTREVRQTTEIHLLLRGRSAAARLVTHYVRLAADEYLARIVNWLLAEVRALPHPLELDPNASPPPASDAARDASIEALRTLTSALWERLVTGPAPPAPLRRLAHEFIAVVSVQFASKEDVAQVAMGAFFFLRILCPAIAVASAALPAAPERRALTLISKVLQQEANGVAFTEPFMAPLTPLIALHRPHLAALLHTMPLPPPPAPLPPAPAPIKVPPARRSLAQIASRLAALLPSLLPALRSAGIRSSRPVAYSPSPRLAHLLAAIPPLPPAPAATPHAAPLSPPNSPHPPPASPKPPSTPIAVPSASPSLAASSSPASSSSPAASTSPDGGVDNRKDSGGSGGSGVSASGSSGSGREKEGGGSRRGNLARQLSSGLVAIGRSGRLVLRLHPRDPPPAPPPAPAVPPLALPTPAAAPPQHSPASALSQALHALFVNKHVAAALLSLAAQHGRVSAVVRPLVELAGPAHAPRLIKRLLKTGRTALATAALRAFAATALTDFLRASLSGTLNTIVANLAAAERSVAADATRLEMDNFSSAGLLRDAGLLFAATAAALPRAPPVLLRLARVLHAQRGSNAGELSAVVEFVVEGAFLAAVSAPDEWHVVGAPLGRVTRTLLELLAKMVLLAALGLAFRAPNTALIDHFLHTDGAALRAAFVSWLTLDAGAAPAPAPSAAPAEPTLQAAHVPALNSVAAFASEHRLELSTLLAPLQLLESPTRPLDTWMRLMFACVAEEA